MRCQPCSGWPWTPAAGPRTALNPRAPRPLVSLPAARPVAVAPAAQARRLVAVGVEQLEAAVAIDAASDHPTPVAFADALRTPSGKDAAFGAHELRVTAPSARARDAPQADALRLAPKYGDPEAAARDAVAANEFASLAGTNANVNVNCAVASASNALPLNSSSSRSQFLGIVLGPVAPSNSPSPCAPCEPLPAPEINADSECEFKPDILPFTNSKSGSLIEQYSAEQLEDPQIYLQILNDLLGDDKSLLSGDETPTPAGLSPVCDAHSSVTSLSDSVTSSSWESADADAESDSLHAPAAKVHLLEQPIAFADAPFSLANLDELDMFALDDLPAPVELF